MNVINSESYNMMEALRRHLSIKVYEVNGEMEVALSFKTVDGKIHQICNSYNEKPVAALLRNTHEAKGKEA